MSAAIASRRGCRARTLRCAARAGARFKTGGDKPRPYMALTRPYRRLFMSVGQEGRGKPSPYSLLPSVDELLQSTAGKHLIMRFSRSPTLRAIRASIAQARVDIQNGAACPSTADLLARAEHTLQLEQQPHLRPVINATGVIINTNLGRAPLSTEALQAVQQVAAGYSNLEYDLDLGE